MNVLDLFSGIGGFSLGLERAGMRTVAFCEVEPYCRAVLAKHWPDVPCYPDVRELTAARIAADGISVDVICGGFPCQDISVAGKGAGLAGARSGLWSHYARLIGELRPKYVVVENVSALLSRGLAEVLGELASLGYDAEWHCIPAAHVGAPHRRDRVWIVAYPGGDQLRNEPGRRRGARGPDSTKSRDDGSTESLADARRTHGNRWPNEQESADRQTRQRDQAADHPERRSEVVADSERTRLETCRQDARESPHAELEYGRTSLADDAQRRRGGESSEMATASAERPNRGRSGEFGTTNDWWSTEPDVGRVAHGVPSRVDRLKSLGNAVVPQIPEIIGWAIMSESL